MSAESLFEQERAYFLPVYRRLPIILERAQGCWLFDVEGRRYLDFLAGIATLALGHGHPRILQAVIRQLQRYAHVSNFFVVPAQLELARWLRQVTGLQRVFFANSGAEAVEAALKLARRWGWMHGREQIWGFSGGFHGRTYGALSLMDRPLYREGMGPYLPKIGTLPYNDPETLERTLDERTCAVVLECIQGEGGVIEASPEFLGTLEQLRRRYGFLFIVDEVQTGLGRTGAWLAVQHYGIVPDIVVLAKALGGGLPLGAIVAGEHLAQVWSAGIHGSTFGGNPAACAAGVVLMEELASGLLEHVRRVGHVLRSQLEELARRFPERIRQVRGRGLMLGIELDGAAEYLRDALLGEGVVVGISGQRVLRILPPLIVSAEEVEFFCAALERVLQRMR